MDNGVVVRAPRVGEIWHHESEDIFWEIQSGEDEKHVGLVLHARGPGNKGMHESKVVNYPIHNFLANTGGWTVVAAMRNCGNCDAPMSPRSEDYLCAGCRGVL